MAMRKPSVDAAELAALVDGARSAKPRPRTGQVRTLIVDRVSSVMQEAHGFSGGEDGFQQAQVRRDAEARGELVVGQVSFQGSGRKLEDEALWGVVNDWAAAGLIDVVACANSSRFARNRARRLLWTLRLQQHGVRVRYGNVQGEDSKETRLQGGMLDVLDEYIGELIAETLANGRSRKAELGQYVANGKRPYGYAYETEYRERQHREVPIGLREDPAQARHVRQIYAWALEVSALEIVARLNAEGVPPPGERMKVYGGKPRAADGPHGWRYSTVYSLLTNPLYKGVATYGRTDRSRAGFGTGIAIAVPAIVDAATWDAVQRRMEERRTMRSGRRKGDAQREGAEDRFALRGLLRCGHCGGALATGGTYGRRRYYRCLRGAAHVARAEGREACALHLLDAKTLEAEAWRFASGVFADGERLARLVRLGREEHAREGAARADALATVRAQLAKQVAKRKRAADALLDLDAADERREDFEEVWAAAQAEVKRLQRDEAELAALPVGGLSEAEAGQIERVAAVVRDGLAELGEGTQEERRRLYGTMGLRGVVRHAPEREGIKALAYTTEWRLELGRQQDGVVQNPHTYSYLCVLCTSDGAFSARILVA